MLVLGGGTLYPETIGIAASCKIRVKPGRLSRGLYPQLQVTGLAQPAVLGSGSRPSALLRSFADFMS